LITQDNLELFVLFCRSLCHQLALWKL
jgi:hypothetical protein